MVFSWANSHATVTQGSIQSLLLFLNYVNDDLSDDFSSKAKLFADDTPIFLVVRDVDDSAKELNEGSRKLMIGLSNEK